MHQLAALILSILVCSSLANFHDSWIDETQTNSINTEIKELIEQTLQANLLSSKEEILKLKNETVEEIKTARDEAQKQLQQFKTEAEKDIEKVKVEANQEIQKVKVEAKEEIQKVKNEAKEEVQKFKEEIATLKVSLEKYQDVESPNTEHLSPRIKRSTGVIETIGAASYSVMEQLVKLMAPISCYQWRQYGFNVSGDYLIDPDGKGLGEPPFTVHCDMVTGYTFILHDSQESVETDNCSGERCYTTQVKYSATEKQIRSLMLVSDSCQQHIKIDCLNSPLRNIDGSLAFWMDRHGKYHDFWAGSSGNHTCSCGLSESCVDPRKNCHCDAGMDDVWLSDDGYLSDMGLLPVQRLTFGSPETQNLQINHTLGPLRCYPRPSIDVPHSCQDLMLSGTVSSGYFLLEDEAYAKVVYCNFNEIYLNKSTDEDIQEKRVQLREVVELEEILGQELEAIRYQLQKFKSIHFIAYTSFTEGGSGRYIKYDQVSENVGGGYNSSTGVFTAPVAGVYYFSVTITTSARVIAVKVSLEKNYNEIAEYKARYRNNDNTFVEQIDLEEGDWVGVRLKRGRAGKISGSTFKGFLLSEV